MTAGTINFPDRKTWKKSHPEKCRAYALNHYYANRAELLRQAKKRNRAWAVFSKSLRKKFLKLYKEGKL